jgi:hypothetical protein
MRNNRSYDADEIDVAARNQRAPIIFDVGDVEFTGNFFGMFTVSTGNRDKLRSFAVPKPWDLRRAGKARPYDSDANNFLVGH